ncbi:uncharacterized protein [Littorina saxatilis]|uniref:Uncharacterized protein n=1 Tax=Littorina saxatilis TaxID=31220 RepID=A0AAN9BG72_9CAEN
MASPLTEIKSLTCSVCLEILDDPRLLQCHHTFCTKCIQDVADRHYGGTSFPCPTCRCQINLPPDGVPALQKNFYITDEDLVRARQGLFHCGVHSGHLLDMYCYDCEELLCPKCVITEHKEHNTTDLTEAAASAKNQLEQNKIRLGMAITTVESRIQATTKEHEALCDKKDAIERNLRSRHAVIVAAANKYLEETLDSLKKAFQTAESNVSADLQTETRNKSALQQLQRRLQDALDNDLPCSLLDVVTEMKEGDGSEESVGKLVPEERNQLVRPVLRCATTKTEDLVDRIHNYFGTVENIQVYTGCHTNDDTKVEPFNIGEEPGTEVFSMCLINKGHIHLSYSWHKGSRTACAEEFDSSGRHTRTFDTATGKASFKSTKQASMQYTQQEGRFITCSKSNEHFSFHNNLTLGRATVKKTIVKSADPFTAEDKEEFTIQCGPHRAFDVDSTDQYFVIVEESKTSNSERKVQLFIRPHEDTPARSRERLALNTEGSATSPSSRTTATDVTYSSPSQPFKPADVCFYKKGHKEVLLIADEINDAIHVVHVRPEELEFTGYLCAGHPLLVQPTALTVDSRNRVWVACRGRVILIVEPDMDIFYDI